jgi:uncharacterized membrane protein YeaQ/YmgE (transglycosylase-associated protein family)
MGLLWTIIVTIVGGIIIGSLGKLVAPGDRDKIPFWLTIVCGIIGMIVGSLIYYAIFGLSSGAQHANDAAVAAGKSKPYSWDNTTKGIDWWRHIWQIAVAALAVMAASFVTSGRKRA